MSEDNPMETNDRQESVSHPLDAIIWALIFIWAGSILLADNLGVLTVWITQCFTNTPLSFLRGLNAWSLVFSGVGLLLVLDILVRSLIFPSRRPLLGKIILAIVMLGIGLDKVISWNYFAPAILIVIGVYILLGGFFRR